MKDEVTSADPSRGQTLDEVKQIRHPSPLKNLLTRESDSESTEYRPRFKSFNADKHLSTLFHGQDRGDRTAPRYRFIPLEQGCSLLTTV